MATASRYWTFVRLNAAGGVKVEEVAAAREFLLQQFPEITQHDKISDAYIQRKLWELRQGGETSDQVTEPMQAPSVLAEYCLRCFISHQILAVCDELKLQFGSQRFDRDELLPLLLDDDLSTQEPLNSKAGYQSLASKILQTFDPTQSSLSTWVSRLARRHRPLNSFLEEYGIYLVSDWAILLRTRPEVIQRILSAHGFLNELEFRKAHALLTAFHAVYGIDRLQQKHRGKRCAPPTMEQLQRMVAYLKTQASINLSPTSAPLTPIVVQQALQQLAQSLRQRMVPAELSLDAEATQFLLNQPAPEPSEADADQDAFLLNYRRAAQTCLQQAVDQAIDRRLDYLRSKPSTQARADDFLRAMLLFHHQGWSMKEIAPKVGWTEQFQVTRLLGLKELQADLYQIWLLLICEKLPTLLQNSLEPEELQPVEQQLTAFLTALHDYQTDKTTDQQKRAKPEVWREQLRQICDAFPLVAVLSGLIEDDLKAYATETYSPVRAQLSPPGTRSLLSVYICRCLTRRAELLD